MTAYILVDIVQVLDDATYATYREEVGPTLSEAGARYLVRGGFPETLSGDWIPNRLIVLSFAGVSEARAWWSSPAYARLKDVRRTSTRSNMVVADGCGSPDGLPGDAKAFIILDVREVRDSATFAAFRDEAAIAVEAKGGTYLIRGGETAVLEGDWRPGRLVLLAFASDEDARGWWAAPDQAALIASLHASTATNVVLVQGLADGASR